MTSLEMRPDRDQGCTKRVNHALTTLFVCEHEEMLAIIVFATTIGGGGVSTLEPRRPVNHGTHMQCFHTSFQNQINTRQHQGLLCTWTNVTKIQTSVPVHVGASHVKGQYTNCYGTLPIIIPMPWPTSHTTSLPSPTTSITQRDTRHCIRGQDREPESEPNCCTKAMP